MIDGRVHVDIDPNTYYTIIGYYINDCLDVNYIELIPMIIYHIKKLYKMIE